MNEISYSSTVSPAFDAFSILDLSHSNYCFNLHVHDYILCRSSLCVHICLLVKCSLRHFIHFFLLISLFSYWILTEMYILDMVLYQLCLWDIVFYVQFSPSLWLVFSFSRLCLSQSRNFKKVSLLNLYFMYHAFGIASKRSSSTSKTFIYIFL